LNATANSEKSFGTEIQQGQKSSNTFPIPLLKSSQIHCIQTPISKSKNENQAEGNDRQLPKGEKPARFYGAIGCRNYFPKVNKLITIAILASFVNFLLPSERLRGGLGWGKKFTTPARIAIYDSQSILVGN